MTRNRQQYVSPPTKHRRRMPSQRNRRLQFESLENRQLLAADVQWDDFLFRSINGSQNNLANPEQGTAHSPLLRTAGHADYPDGIGETMIDESVRANPRAISNQVAAQGDKLLPNNRRMSDLVWQWGQFLDHDIDLTDSANENGMAPIAVKYGDPLWPVIPFSRSNHEYDEQGVRQQVNEITAYIDASNVYGSDETRAKALRTMSGGLLKTSAGNLLPMNEPGLPNAGGDGSDLFLAGDVRANEQVGLTVLHTLFVREHNRLAGLIAEECPEATDEQIYQLARKIVGAEIQVITYEEFLPALLGKAALPRYTGYDEAVDASITNEFATAFYRLGHSMLSPSLMLVNIDGKDEGGLPLREAFFRPDYLKQDPANLERLLHGLMMQKTQEIDNKIVDDVRNFLFGEPGQGGLDLASLNIQRGRDHGLPDYNSLREAYGLPRITKFKEITADRHVRRQLREVYGNVDNIDPWVGGLAEDHVKKSSVGPLVQAGLVDQFTRLRDGDRFFYRHDPDLRHKLVRRVIDLKRVRLSDIIEWNTDLDELRKNVFRVPAKGRPLDLTIWLHCLSQSAKGQQGSPSLLAIAICVFESHSAEHCPSQHVAGKYTDKGSPTWKASAVDASHSDSEEDWFFDDVLRSLETTAV